MDDFYKKIDILISSNKISHAYLFEVNDYDTDLSFIFNFIKMILCPKKKLYNELECGFCNICSQINSKNYLDLEIIYPDGNFIRKNQLLQLQEKFREKSFIDNKQVYIIMEADKLNSSSANTMLKFLEEPEDDIIGILVTKNRYKVIDTITSRCQILSLPQSTESFNIDDNVIDILKFFLSPSQFFIQYKEINEKYFIDKVSIITYLSLVEKIFVAHIENKTNEDKVNNILNSVSFEKMIKYILIIEEELLKLEYNLNIKLWLDRFYSRLIEVDYD